MERLANSKRIEPLRREKLSDVAVRVIREYIANNGLAPGQKLPSERELAAALNVGTRSIREALRNLEARGVVRIEHGKGTYVDEKYRNDFAKFLADTLELGLGADQEMLLHLMYVRRIIETSIIPAVVEKLDREHDRLIGEILSQLESAFRANRIEEYNEGDIALHKAIVGMTNNRILISLYDRMSDLFSASFARTANLPGSMQQSIHEHTVIVEHIRQGDVEAARAMMSVHLDHTDASLRTLLNRAKTKHRASRSKSA